MLNRPSSRRPKMLRQSFRVSPLILALVLCSVTFILSGLAMLFYRSSGQDFVKLDTVTLPTMQKSDDLIGPPHLMIPTPDPDSNQPVSTQLDNQSTKSVASKDRPLISYAYQKSIPIIVFTFNRPDNLRMTLESLFAALPAHGFAVYVSQDGDDAAVRAVIDSFENRVTRLSFQYTGTPRAGYSVSYQKIAAHYGFALAQVFDKRSESHHFDRVILLEDDMKLAPDFFSYFRSLAPLFDTDPSLYCVSAWNDNGQPKFIKDATQLYRTDCFPGLGWMMPRALWEELGRENWTWGFWDDWLREPPQRKGRSCIYPEVNRVSTFGSVGTSGGQFYEQFLRHIQVNTQDVCWNDQRVDLMQQSSYDGILRATLKHAQQQNDIAQAQEAIDAELNKGTSANDVSEQRVQYTTLEQLTQMILPIGLITDHKAGVPRTSYKGVMQFRHKGVRIWLYKNDAPLLMEETDSR